MVAVPEFPENRCQNFRNPQERLNAAAEWKMGASAEVSLQKLDGVRQEVKRLGFRQQLRLIERQKRRVLRGDRSVVTR